MSIFGSYAEKLVKEARVKVCHIAEGRYYDINWTVVEVKNLGRVHLMFTNGNSI
ncbi:hypothetical protein [Pedobacter flavus]|uniref:Uncharacterized protein n=1 Tax=Pedobacter flavus TaxID=3113906 RepID=A0ABU7H021_9SPHI|nr:hypothetical protein [Pedobacter sp. VNH31]MEE1884378.1 hypothetical protein [Pedobacter sp. VNH31]